MVARLLVRVAVGCGLLTTTLGTVFVAGYALDDPGGRAGAALVASWLVPLVGLTWIAWRHPSRLLPWLAGLCVLPVAVSVWAVADRAGAAGAMDAVGPVPAVLVLVLGAPLVVVGRVHPFEAGALALVVSVLPPAVLLVGEGAAPVGSTGVAGAPLLLAAVLLLASAALGRRDARREAGAVPV